MPKKVASFIPYRETPQGLEFFMQKRDGNAPTDPNVFSTFGGHLEEGEESLPGVLREIQEELIYVPQSMKLFKRFEYDNKEIDVYYEKVGSDFESRVDVQEGEYGKFLSLDEIVSRSDTSYHAKLVIPELAVHVAQK